MEKQQKVKIVDEVNGYMAGAKAVVLTSFERLTVEAETKLRRDVRKANGRYKVVRNTLARRALVGDQWADVRRELVGNTALSFADGDVVGLLKALVDFSKENENFKIKCGVVEGKPMTDAEVKRLASLPSREVLVAQLLATLQAPIRNLVNVLSAPHRNLAMAVKAIADKKSGEAAQA